MMADHPHDDRGPATSALVEEWAQVVRECEAGYGWNVYEYHNDLSVRDTIARRLADPATPVEDRTELATRAAEVDARFQALLQPEVEVGPVDDPWWHRGVLRYAGEELAAELREWFGVKVEVRETAG
jgi:hypothetical protein